MKKSLKSSLAVSLLISLLPLGQAFATKHVITVQNFSFTPSSITDVIVGDTMRWEWVSGSHTTTSTIIPAGAATWDSPINSANPSFEYKVAVAGTFNYKCTPHAAMGMVGSFVASAPVATLSITPSNRNVQSAAGSTTFSVTSNSNWTALSNATWCTVNPSGSGNGTVTATYASNLSVTQRLATITVTVAGIPSQQVTVTQAGAAATLSVDPANQDVSYQSGTTTFNVTSNTTWTAVSGSNWCTATPSGTGNGTITATYGENPTNAVRVATITISVTGLTPKEVTVTQDLSTVSVNEIPGKAFNIYPNPTKGNFTLSPGELNNKTLEISVINAIGTVVYSQKESGSDSYSFDLGSLARGSYLIRIVSDEGTKFGKLLLIN